MSSGGRRLQHAVAVPVVGKAAALVLATIHIALVARILPRADFADFSAAFALLGIVAALAEFGLQTTLVLRRSAGPPADGPAAPAGGVPASDVVASFGLLAVGAAVGLAVAEVLLGPDARSAFVLLLPWLVAARFDVAWVAALQHDLRVERIAASELAARLVLVAATAMVMVAGTEWSKATRLRAIAAVMVAAEVVSAAVVVPSAGRVSGRPTAAAVRAIVAATLPLGLTNAASFVHARADQVVLAADGRRIGLARYAVAYRGVDAGLAIANSVSGLTLALFARARAADRPVVGRAITRLMAGAGALAGSALWVAAPLVMLLLGGDRYRDDGPLLRALAPALFFSVANAGVAQVALGSGKTPLLLRTSLVAVAVNVALNVALVPSHGVGASVVATTVTEGIGWIVVAAVAARAVPGAVAARDGGAAALAFIVAGPGAVLAGGVALPLGAAAFVAGAAAAVAVAAPGLRMSLASRPAEECQPRSSS